MNRSLALLAALVLTAISVSSACIASPSKTMSFSLQAHSGRPDVQFSLNHGDRRNQSSMSGSFELADLPGLDVNALRQPGQRPISFAYIREAGRVDCSGTGGNSIASGRCNFTPNAGFSDFLAARGIGRPSLDEAYALTMTHATRELVDALAQNRYPRPNIEKLTELSAVGVDRPFIAGLAARGFAPKDLDDLTQFAALDITPAYIDALSRVGYRGLSADEITEFKAVGVDPAFIGALAQAGYRNLAAGDLVQLAALKIDPGFIRSFAQIGYSNLPVDTLVQLKALDVTPEFVRSLNAHGLHPSSA